MSIRFHLFILTLLVSIPTFAQQDSISRNKSFTDNYENDFFYVTDMYYTQGIRLELVFPSLSKLPLMNALPHLSNSITEYGLAAVQDCYTPTSISKPYILYGNRPYAAAIYLGHYAISTNETKKEKLTSEVDLGVIGPCAVCEEEQKSIHRALNNIQPEGWQYQIGTNLLFNYRLRFEKGILNDSAISFMAMTETNLGTYYDNASLGLDLHFGKMQSYFSGNHSRRFQFYGFLQGWTTFVAYNTTLEGGLLNNSPYTLTPSEIDNIILKWPYGICLSYKKISLEFSKVYITKEIIAGLPHGWGHVSITDNF